MFLKLDFLTFWFGDRLLLLCDPIVYDLVGKELEENLLKEGAFVHREIFHGEAN